MSAAPSPNVNSMSGLQYTNLPSDISGEDVLIELALDVNWTLSRAADTIWRQLNTELWERTHNPWAVLPTVSGPFRVTV